MTKSRGQSGNATFVEIALTEKQKSALAKDDAFKAGFWKSIDLFSAQHLKVTLRWDDYNDCAMVSLQDSQVDFGEPTTIWTLRSSSLSGALLKICYYFAVLSDQTLPSGATKKEFDDDESLWT